MHRYDSLHYFFIIYDMNQIWNKKNQRIWHIPWSKNLLNIGDMNDDKLWKIVALSVVQLYGLIKWGK